ncbi:site-2 protease family protein [Halobacillus salinarum]|uniref:Site-2 protease family protein n=1 Tax=Halobacillus salinarum TaxID=2932257 RepID=A0ABY4EP58_9BACI|nr:site-2 protease family protein [Halobacillus salinarum]UOQ46254.1 site-2 protease family protein [Halobacillus salinarum]
MKTLKLSRQIHVHPLFFFLAFSALLTGAIYEFIILFSIVAIHELGHFFTARYFGWRVECIEFWLFGGAVVSEEHNTRPFHEQVLVVIAGPLQHVWIFILVFGLQIYAGPHHLLEQALEFNGLILLCNLLPIWPLDGGKLVFYCCNQFLSFRNSLTMALLLSSVILSVTMSWLIFADKWTLASILLASFLIVENLLEWKRRGYTFIRYLMYCRKRDSTRLQARYVTIDENVKVRDALKNIRANRMHYYVLKQTNPLYIVNEQECLQAYFQRKSPNLRLRDIVN